MRRPAPSSTSASGPYHARSFSGSRSYRVRTFLVYLALLAVVSYFAQQALLAFGDHRAVCWGDRALEWGLPLVGLLGFGSIESRRRRD